MRRRLFNLAATVSLVLFTAACLMWLRSYQVRDTWCWGPPPREWCVDSRLGYVTVSRRVWESDWAGPLYGYFRYPIGEDRGWRELFDRDRPRLLQGGVNVTQDPGGTPTAGVDIREINVHVCYWLACALAAPLPLAAAARRVKRLRRRQRGLCRSCGYDLTGNVSAVCPECGTAVAR